MRAAPASPVGSALVKAMEVAVVFSPGDYAGYLERGRSAAPSDGASGFEYSGSFAGRNIEKIYELAEAFHYVLRKRVCIGQKGVKVCVHVYIHISIY